MRILRLDLDDGMELDFHPYVTIVSGLTAAAQRHVVNQISQVVRGDVEAVSGLVESHYMLIDIRPDRMAALDLPHHADIVVHAEQLPGARPLPSSSLETDQVRAIRERIVLGESDMEQVTGEIEQNAERLASITIELDDARRGLDELAITAHEAATRALAETESFVRGRLEEKSAIGGPAVTYQPETDAEWQRADAARRLAEQRRRHMDLEMFLDDERLNLLETLERLESERLELERMRAELDAAAQRPVPPAGVPEDPVSDPDLPDLAEQAVIDEVDALIRAVENGPPPAALVPSLPAAALADQIHAHRQREVELDEDLRADGLDAGALRQELRDTKAMARETEHAARPRMVSDEDSAEIERLHEIVLDNVDKQSKRLGGREATRRYEEATAALGEVLGRNGLSTYTDFIMARIAPPVDEPARQRHHEVLARVDELEAELERVEAAIDQNSQVRMLRAEREQLWASAADLLGSVTQSEDLERVLRTLQVPESVEFTAADELRLLLDRLGVDLADVASTEDLLRAGLAWRSETEARRDAVQALADTAATPSTDPGGDQTPLTDSHASALAELNAKEAEVQELAVHASELDAVLMQREAESEELEAEVAALEAELTARHDTQDEVAPDPRHVERQPHPDDLAEAQLAADPAVMSARDQAQRTLARVERHQRSVILVDQFHAELVAARNAERALRSQRDGLVHQLDRYRSEVAALGEDTDVVAPVEWTLTDEGLDPIEWHLLGRVTSLRSLSASGSVPLVLHQAFRGLPDRDVVTLCAALSRVAESVQIIYIGDEPAILEWATNEGLDVAAVVLPTQPTL